MNKINSSAVSTLFSKQHFEQKSSGDLAKPDRWEYLSHCYEAWKQRQTKQVPIEGSIPHIIHQIWLGSPLPEKYQSFCDSWKAFNPGFEYHLWDDEAIRSILKGKIAELYDKTENYGAKSDIARYAILLQYGGLYADTDFECVQSFAPLLDNTSFCAGLTVDNSPQIMNSLIACSAGHPVLERTIADIKAPVTGHRGRSILESTGPFHFTESFFNSRVLHRGTEVVLPSPYLYPFPSADRHKRFANSMAIKDRYLTDDSFALHYWEVSWQKKEAALVRVAKKILKTLLPWNHIKKLLSSTSRRPPCA